MNDTKNPYAGYRYPAEIISQAVWPYFRFTLSYREVEEMLAARGILVTDETIRPWYLKFGQDFANERRRRAPRRGDTWYLDEVYLRLNGRRYYLWRAVDQDGYVLDIRVQPRRDKRAAKHSFRQLLRGCSTCRGSSSPTSSRLAPRARFSIVLRSMGLTQWRSTSEGGAPRAMPGGSSSGA
jgi:putative transposase